MDQNPKQGEDGPNPEDGVRHGPTWVLIVGCVFLGVGVIFLMAMIVAAINGNEVPPGSRMLVVFLMALVVAMGSAFLGGWARAQGRIRLPGTSGSHQLTPVKFGVGGGIAVFLIVMLAGWLLYARDAAPATTVSIDSVRGTGSDSTAVINANYTLRNLGDNRLFYVVVSGDDSATPIRSERIDDPDAEEVTIILTRASAESLHLQLVVKDAAGEVVTESESMPVNVVPSGEAP